MNLSDESRRREVRKKEKEGGRKEYISEQIEPVTLLLLCVLGWQGLDGNEGTGDIFLKEGKCFLYKYGK